LVKKKKFINRSNVTAKKKKKKKRERQQTNGTEESTYKTREGSKHPILTHLFGKLVDKVIRKNTFLQFLQRFGSLHTRGKRLVQFEKDDAQ
jgi:hypothetical protein